MTGWEARVLLDYLTGAGAAVVTGTGPAARWSLPPGDGPLPPARRAGVRTLHEEVRVLAEGTHEAPLGRAGLLRPCRNEHQAEAVIGDSDRSFVQWQGRGPTNRRRGFDSLNSDRRHEPP